MDLSQEFPFIRAADSYLTLPRKSFYWILFDGDLDAEAWAHRLYSRERKNNLHMWDESAMNLQFQCLVEPGYILRSVQEKAVGPLEEFFLRRRQKAANSSLQPSYDYGVYASE